MASCMHKLTSKYHMGGYIFSHLFGAGMGGAAAQSKLNFSVIVRTAVARESQHPIGQ